MNNDWLDIAVLEDYLEGKLDAKTMNRIEREALDDPFIAEALAGLSTSPKRSLESLSLLQKQLKERIAQHQNIKRTSVITWQRLSIAATAAVLFVSVSIIFWMKEVNLQQMAAKQPKKVEVTIAPRVFKDSIIESADVVAVNEIKKPVSPVVTTRNRTHKNISAAQDDDKPLVPNEQALNEVAVLGYRALEKEEKLASGPVGGWDNLFAYISKNSVFKDGSKIGQSVTLSFTIDEDGTPAHIQIVKGVAAKYDAEAIRLILNGPKWQQPKIKESPVTFKIDF